MLERRDAGRDRLEREVPFDRRGVQDLARRLPCRSRQTLALKPEIALGCERFYLAPRGVVRPDDLPKGWGLLEYHDRRVNVLVKAARQSQRTPEGFMNEMNLLLASLRRVEVRIEPQTITDFLKWKNRMVEYNGGVAPEGIVTPEQEPNGYLCAD